MRSARSSLLAASALALGLGTAAVTSGPADLPGFNEARSAGKNVPVAAGVPGQPASPDDRRRWLRSRHTAVRYRRRSTGTHKQNRRRALAGR